MPPIPIEHRRRQTAARLAALTLANAFIFQEQLADTDARVHSIRRLLAQRDFISATAEHWQFICRTINYIPIFNIANEVLCSISSGMTSDNAVRSLATRALTIVSRKAALRHDLMGRIYHYLLHDAKYLGTFYTSVPGATLLLKLAIGNGVKAPALWSDIEQIAKIRIADLACGTGTLLMAASQAITDNFIRATVSEQRKVDNESLRDLHRSIMENIVCGYDVLPSAVHLTAATLALLAPEVSFRKMQLHSLPLGKDDDGQVYLGSIEYLHRESIATQLDLMGIAPSEGAAASMGAAGTVPSTAPLPQLDLCVMNPPFVRSVNGNFLFGSLPQHRAEMQAKLRRDLRTGNVMANSTAGLGSVFVAIGDRYVKPGGRLALVLPAAVTTGGSWAKTRALIEQHYVLEFLVASHDPHRWSFSENTELSEVLLVARKRLPREELSKAVTNFVNLWSMPKASADALFIGDQCLNTQPPSLGDLNDTESGVARLTIGTNIYGEILAIPWQQLRGQPWVGSAFAQTHLSFVNWKLRQGQLHLAGHKRAFPIPICALGKIGTFGPDGRDIHDGFEKTSYLTPYAGFWNNDASTIRSKSNCWLSARANPAPGRPRRPPGLLWPKAARIMIAVRLRFNTQRLAAVYLDEASLANVWYPFSLKQPDEAAEKALTLWLNSTLGILLLAGHRVPTQGSWVQFKKPVLTVLPTLAMGSLSTIQIQALAQAYDRIADQTLQPIAQINDDLVRERIDYAIERVLSLPSLKSLRDQLAQEPVICNLSILRDEQEIVEDSEQFRLFA